MHFKKRGSKSDFRSSGLVTYDLWPRLTVTYDLGKPRSPNHEAVQDIATRSSRVAATLGTRAPDFGTHFLELGTPLEPARGDPHHCPGAGRRSAPYLLSKSSSKRGAINFEITHNFQNRGCGLLETGAGCPRVTRAPGRMNLTTQRLRLQLLAFSLTSPLLERAVRGSVDRRAHDSRKPQVEGHRGERNHAEILSLRP